MRQSCARSIALLAAFCAGAAVVPHLAQAQQVAPAEAAPPESVPYRQLQQRLSRGWNTWDVNSVATQVLLPDGLAIHVGMQRRSTEGGEVFQRDFLIGAQDRDAPVVIPGAHSWNGSYTDLRVNWAGSSWRLQSAWDGPDLVLLATPLSINPASAVAPAIVFSVNYLWNRPGTMTRRHDSIETHGSSGSRFLYCTCAPQGRDTSQAVLELPVAGPYFWQSFDAPVGVGTGTRRSLSQIAAIVERQRKAYEDGIAKAAKAGPALASIESTLGWDTIYEPTRQRVISPVSRSWCIAWGGYVLFDWDTFFAATLASIGDRDLAYANAMEMLREETPQGFVPNYARGGGWKSFDRSEPPVGAITVLGLYRKFHDRWFLQETFEPLLRWNRWWATHRDLQGYLTWGSDNDTRPTNPDDHSSGTRQGAIYESGLDNSPMYDSAVFNPHSHLLEFADVGLMSLYIADCQALAQIADVLNRSREARELRDRSARYSTKLQTMWSPGKGIFLNKDLRTGHFTMRLSPTNFYPMLAGVATDEQARTMIEKHLLNPDEFWGQWVIPSIARNDAAFSDQNYWRGRIWGPMNYLVYLGLRSDADTQTRREFAQKSYALFLAEWNRQGHVHENYNAVTGEGDDVHNSDRFYHWGALLAYIEYLEESRDGSK